jgi:hypothetical protein
MPLLDGEIGVRDAGAGHLVGAETVDRLGSASHQPIKPPNAC